MMEKPKLLAKPATMLAAIDALINTPYPGRMYAASAGYNNPGCKGNQEEWNYQRAKNLNTIKALYIQESNL